MQRVDDTSATLRPTSTQEDAWLLLAASAIAKDASKVSLNVNGETIQRPLYRRVSAADLNEPLRVANAGEDQVKAAFTVTGAPAARWRGARPCHWAWRRRHETLRFVSTTDGKPEPIAVKITGAVAPITLLVNGVPVPSQNQGTLLFAPDGPGFVRVTVIDSTGSTDSVLVRIDDGTSTRLSLRTAQ